MLLRTPLRTLIVAGCCIAALAIAGVPAESKLHQTSLSISGTESARTEALLRRYFGESEPFIVLLKGPPRDVNVQGRQLVRTLNRDPLATTISPWSREAIAQLRPSRRTAVIFVSYRVSLDEAVKQTVPHLNELLKRDVSPPVRAVQSGYASVSRAIQDEAAQATQRGELIAVPLVLIVLLLVFRSPIAASIPLAFGGATVAASRGILTIAANWLSIDAFALTVSAMMGLALGVDYTLLMVSRFREELAAGKPPIVAARGTRRTAGRTIAFAGGALFVSMVASALILPGTFLVSLAGAVVIVAGLSVVLGVLVVPALLALVGERIDKWSLGRRRKGQGRWSLLTGRVLHRPGLAVAALTVPLLLLALPAVSLSVGPPNPDQLPSTNRARLNAELVNREIGPGWAAPYVVLAATHEGAITSKSKLAALRRWEQAVGKSGGVQAVVGPGGIARRVEPISRFGRSFLAQGQSGSQAAQLQQLGSRLGHAAQGVKTLRTGIAQATYGAGLLAEDSRNLGRGTEALATGLTATAVGGSRAANALDRFASGTREVRRGQHRAAMGGLALKYGIRDLIPRLRHSTLLPLHRLDDELTAMRGTVPYLENRTDEVEGQLATALLEFQRLPESPSDPHYLTAIKAVQAAQELLTSSGTSSAPGHEAGVSTSPQDLGAEVLHASERTDQATSGADHALEELQEEAALARRLVQGLTRLEQGGQSLDIGAHRLARSATALADGLPRLSHGATALSGGTEQLTAGSTSLAEHLDRGYTLSRPLEPGLKKAATQSTSGSSTLRGQSHRLRELSPGILQSGYLNLAALDGTPASARSKVEQAVDVDRGGQAARILVIPKHEGSVELDSRLRADAPRLARRLDGTAGVAGGPAVLNDYSHQSRSRLPVVVAVVSLVTFLSLALILRALVVPALTVILNLLSVAVAFGVLALVSSLPSGAPIGHWGYIDTIGAVAIFAIAFGVSIDYSVFILVRMREEFDRTGDHRDAVRTGFNRTARVITGAALMMVAVFAAFATSSLAIVSQLGVGLTVAILMDATVIRLVLLPALLLLVGERAWWLPAPLIRLFRNLRLT